MARADELHASSEIREVDLDKLKVDRSYQRDFSQQVVDQIQSTWDIVASELLIVSDRGPRTNDPDVDGGLFIVNGQHRSIAARRLGHTTIWARVINLRKEKDPAAIEAALRLKTGVRLGDRATERFKAQLRAGDPESLAIVKILNRFGTDVSFTTPDMGLTAVSALESIYRMDGTGGYLNETLEMIRDAFGGYGGKSGSSAMLKGITWFIDKHADQTNRSRLIEKLKEQSSGSIDRKARTIGAVMGGALWMNYYRAIVEVYNEGLRDSNRLEWQLRRGSASLGASGKAIGSGGIRRGGGR